LVLISWLRLTRLKISDRTRNQTITDKLARDPRIGALVQVADRIHAHWREQDRQAAEAQVAAAQATLRKLEEERAKITQPTDRLGISVASK
jgi:hypothetical protein